MMRRAMNPPKARMSALFYNEADGIKIIKRERAMKRKKPLTILAILILSLFFIAGCGENAGDGTPSGGGSTATSAASITLLVSSPQLNSDGATTVNLTALVKDSGNRALSGQSVSFSANSGSLVVTSGTTDVNGNATATLGTGGDPSNRTITVTAATGSISATNTVGVTGTTLAISGLSSLSFGASTPLTVTLTGSSGTGISGKTVTLTSLNGNTLAAATYTTDGSGQISVTVTAAVGGVDTITASAIGATKTFTLTVNPSILTITAPTSGQLITISPTVQNLTARYTVGGVPVADGTTITFATTLGLLSAATATTTGGNATVTVSSSQTGPAVLSAFAAAGPSDQTPVEFVATTANSVALQVNPAVIGTNAAGVTVEKSLITAVVRDVNNNLVKDKTVSFSRDLDASGGQLSPPSGITDSSGTVSTYFIAGAAPGAVTIRATETASGKTATIPLTVAKKALFISLATGNIITTLTDNVRYQKNYVALVTDSVGNPVVGATVTAKLTPMYFKKGYYLFSVPTSTWYPVDTIIASSSTLPNIPACANEDSITHNTLYDYNGVLDPGEDVNGNGRLDPGNVAAVTATATDATGHSTLSVVYAKDFAHWVNVKLEAWANLGGSTTNASVTFDLPIAGSELTTASTQPPGYISPFGTSQTCFVDLILVPVTASRIDLSWTASAAAASYNIYRGGVLLINVATNSYSDIGLLTNTNYCYRIKTVNNLGVEAATWLTDQICSMTLSTPVAPLGLTATAVSSTQINLSWTAATNAVSYRVYRNGVLLKAVTATGTTDTGLTANTTYSYAVSALDAAGNESPQSSTVIATTGGTGAAPTGLTATPINATQIDLTWVATAGAAGYNIYRTGGGANKTFSSPTAFTSDVALTTQTQYCYRVASFDVSGNESLISAQVCASTP
jgi:fibronectin type 3 domain-containing protein